MPSPLPSVPPGLPWRYLSKTILPHSPSLPWNHKSRSPIGPDFPLNSQNATQPSPKTNRTVNFDHKQTTTAKPKASLPPNKSKAYKTDSFAKSAAPLPAILKQVARSLSPKHYPHRPIPSHPIPWQQIQPHSRLPHHIVTAETNATPVSSSVTKQRSPDSVH
jgi:hypothetical protein